MVLYEVCYYVSTAVECTATICLKPSVFNLQTSFDRLCNWRKVFDPCRITCTGEYSVLPTFCEYSVLPTPCEYSVLPTSCKYSVLANILYYRVFCNADLLRVVAHNCFN